MLYDDGDPLALAHHDLSLKVKQAGAAELREWLATDRRGAILTELVHRMPDSFRADRATRVRAVVHWRIGGRPDGGDDTYQMEIGDGRCVVSDAVDRPANLTLSIGAVEFVQMVTGNAHPVALVMRGKLRSSGDVRLTASFPRLFDVPVV